MGSRKSDKTDSGDGASPGKIFIGGLAKDTSLETFVKYFEKYGEITDSVIMKDRHTGRARGFGFITYADPSVVDQLIEDKHVINGKEVEIKRTIPKGSSNSHSHSHSNHFKTKKIFVGGIPTSLSQDDFKNFFSNYGNVVDHEIIRDHTTKRSRGFGFVVFDNDKVVDDILSHGNMIHMAGTQVEIKKAEPKKSSNSGSLPPFPSHSRARSYTDTFPGFADSCATFGASGYGPGSGSYRSLGGFGGSRLGDYGGYGGEDFSASFGGYAAFRGESSFGYSSRYGSYMGGLGAGYGGNGLGAYGRGGGGYGTYGGPGAVGVYDSGPAAGYRGAGGAGAGAGGVFPTRGNYAGSSRYHPYAR